MIQTFNTATEACRAIHDAEGKIARVNRRVVDNYRRRGMKYVHDARPTCDTVQGKCAACSAVYHWRASSELRLSAAHCPEHSTKLERTISTFIQGVGIGLPGHSQVAVTGEDRLKLLARP